MCLHVQGLDDMVGKLGPLMYWNGKGELITRTDYMRWKYRNNQVRAEQEVQEQPGEG